MKKIIFAIILFSTFIITIDSVLSACSPLTPCCCQEYPGGEEKCFTSGICCLEGLDQFWDPISCFKFDFWVEPEHGIFKVGSETRINLYIKNTGAFADNYGINYNVTDNPNLIKVNMAGASPVNDVVKGEIRVVYPRIIVLATTASGKVFFNATSLTDQNVTRNATLTVLPSDLPVSLPEFGFIQIFMIIILVAIVFLNAKNFS